MDPQAQDQDPAEKEEDAFMLTKLVEGYPELVRSSWSPVARDPDPESNTRLASKFKGNKPFRHDKFVWLGAGVAWTRCHLFAKSTWSPFQA